MSSHKGQLRSAIGISAVVSLYGIATLLVYYVGPALGLSLTYQIVIIGLILLTWPFAVLVSHYRRKRQEKLSASGDKSRAAEPATRAVTTGAIRAPSRTYDELTRSTEEAVQWLRSSRLGASKSGDAIYRLPWMLIAGPSASGKTSLLLSAGLDFHAIGSQRRADQHLVRPTRDCEWRVTDWAMLLDTAGRYQTEGPDSDEWSALIETVKKYRKTRPLDGVVIIVDASRLLAGGEAEIEQQAKALRVRLDEVIARTQVRFPVYLVFGHMDSIEGFEHFFRTFDVTGRGQVWGTTIALEQSANAHALFDVEFDYLYDSLMRHRLIRLGLAEEPEEQLHVFNFPLYFGEGRRKLGLFTSALFRPNPFSESPFMRGFYFTSSGANGRPASENSTPARLFEAAADQYAAGPQVAAEGYFTESLFKEVLLRDKDLAASFQAGQKHPERMRNILLGVAATLLIISSIWMIIAYFKSQILVRNARAAGVNMMRYLQPGVAKDPAKEDPAFTSIELTAIDSVRKRLEEIDKYDGSLASWLFSVNSVKPYLRATYFDAMNHRFFKPTVAGLEVELQAFAEGKASPNAIASSGDGEQRAGQDVDLGHYYDLLKAYLMLSNPDKVEPTFLYNQLLTYWKKSTPQGSDEAIALDQLDYYTKRARDEESPHIKPAEKLVGDAQNKLSTYSVVERVYKNIKTEIDGEVPPVTLESILQRSGVISLTSAAKVPGSFTISGYNKYMSRIESAANKVDEDAWVMGPFSKANPWQGGDTAKLQEKYFDEYVEQWKGFLKGIGVPKYDNANDAREKLKQLSATDSPAVKVVKEVARQTNLTNASGGNLISWIGSLFSSSKDKKTAGKVDAEFAPLAQFVSGDAESQYRTGLADLQDRLYDKTPEQLKQDSKVLTDLTQGVSKRLESLNAKQGSREAAALLRQPLDKLNEMLSSSNYEEIKQNWKDQIYPKAQALESAFPFGESAQDVPLGNLIGFLSPSDGQLSNFVKNNLTNSFDQQWKLKESFAPKDKFSEGFRKYLSDAWQLREALFGNNNQIDVSYEITLQPVQGAEAEIEIDGQKVKAPGNSSVIFKWSNNPGASGAKVTVSKGGGEPKSLEKPGKWGVFRLFREGGLNAKGEGPYQVAWTLNGVRVQATVKPSRSPNPFQLELFKLRAPQSPGE